MGIEQIEISGSAERITFYSPETGYTVLRLKPDKRAMLPYQYATRDELATVVGNLPDINPGEWLKLKGRWLRHAKHGWQFKAEQCEKGRPATLEGIKRYLGSGMVRGVGKVMAERIVNKFGEETLTVIDNDPARLREVLGIGQKRVVGITKAWDEQREIQNVMLFLQSHNISTGLAVKIYKQYKDESLTVVQNTPYKLVKDIRGIGFKTADQIAQSLGLAADDPNRIEAGIAHTLNEKAGNGHVYVPQHELEPQASEMLGLEPEKIRAVIEQLEGDNLIKRDTLIYPSAEAREASDSAVSTVREEQAIYLVPFFYSEVGVTNRIRKMVHCPVSRVRTAFRSQSHAFNLLAQIEKRSAMKLAEQQRNAVLTALRNHVTVLTGGPGTGKTTTLRTLLDMLDGVGRRYLLASPTGRAAKRLGEATGREAKTIHRLLDFKPGTGFGRNEENPLDTDMIVIDEASMLDLIMANNLLKAIPPETHLVLVGDVDQLPSVGAGDVLRDLIASEVPAIVRLDVVFRQSAESLIIQNAHRINQGQMPLVSAEARDFFVFVKDDIEELPKLIVDIVKTRIPTRFGFDPMADVQVLAPMYQGRAGVSGLNLHLQAALNPPSKHKLERRYGGRVLRVGDKVMQTVNNYDKNVYNGDIGRITAIDPVAQLMTLNIDGAPVVYDFSEADELMHAYAISVHKSQGSEYPCVVMPVVTQHYMMLQRNLLYTAITRAKKLVILVGTRKAIRIAVRNNRVAQRHSALDLRLNK